MMKFCVAVVLLGLAAGTLGDHDDEHTCVEEKMESCLKKHSKSVEDFDEGLLGVFSAAGDKCGFSGEDDHDHDHGHDRRDTEGESGSGEHTDPDTDEDTVHKHSEEEVEFSIDGDVKCAKKTDECATALNAAAPTMNILLECVSTTISCDKRFAVDIVNMKSNMTKILTSCAVDTDDFSGLDLTDEEKDAVSDFCGQEENKDTDECSSATNAVDEDSNASAITSSVVVAFTAGLVSYLL